VHGETRARPLPLALTYSAASGGLGPGPDVHALALRAEEHKQFDDPRADAAEPVRDAGIELGGLAGLHDEVMLGEPQPQPPESRPRQAVGPDGEVVTIHDAILRALRD
jgi:hypothetical protein